MTFGYRRRGGALSAQFVGCRRRGGALSVAFCGRFREDPESDFPELLLEVGNVPVSGVEVSLHVVCDFSAGGQSPVRATFRKVEPCPCNSSPRIRRRSGEHFSELLLGSEMCRFSGSRFGRNSVWSFPGSAAFPRNFRPVKQGRFFTGFSSGSSSRASRCSSACGFAVFPGGTINVETRRDKRREEGDVRRVEGEERRAAPGTHLCDVERRVGAGHRFERFPFCRCFLRHFRLVSQYRVGDRGGVEHDAWDTPGLDGPAVRLEDARLVLLGTSKLMMFLLGVPLQPF